MGDFGSTDPYEDLPEDPELAFLRLEAHFRADCERRIQQAEHNERTDVIHVDYIAQVLAAISALGLEAEFQSKVPSIEDVDYGTYLNFNKDVKHYRTMLEIRNSRRAQGYSVQFDETAKRRIHHHLKQVHEIFIKLEIDEKKREDLFTCLEALQKEVNRSRTHFDRLAALSIAAASITGEAVEKSRLLEILDSIARVFWGAQAETAKKLPRPIEAKKIEPPRAPIPKPKPGMDDDIPF